MCLTENGQWWFVRKWVSGRAGYRSPSPALQKIQLSRKMRSLGNPREASWLSIHRAQTSRWTAGDQFPPGYTTTRSYCVGRDPHWAATWVATCKDVGEATLAPCRPVLVTEGGTSLVFTNRGWRNESTQWLHHKQEGQVTNLQWNPEPSRRDTNPSVNGDKVGSSRAALGPFASPHPFCLGNYLSWMRSDWTLANVTCVSLHFPKEHTEVLCFPLSQWPKAQDREDQTPQSRAEQCGEQKELISGGD